MMQLPDVPMVTLGWRSMLRLACVVLLAGASISEARTERDRAQVRAFRAENACPATGRTRGACPGWHVDHVIALCAGGPDRPDNMQWITREDHRFKTLVDVRECRKERRAKAWR